MSARTAPPLACRVTGHRMRFWAEGETMRWGCERCELEGAKAYATPELARRYARALDREDRDDIGKRSPVSMLLLRLARRTHNR
ncbi:MAG TPA: hypothetical protein VIL04_10610 [Solirubrobacterales bacterium]|jgi:hypothetical protein